MLSRSEAVYAALNAGVVIHAADSEILEANDRARSMLGIGDLEGRLATDPTWVFKESDGTLMPVERFPVVQVMNSGAAVRGLVMIIQPPTRPETWIEVNALPIRDDQGRLREIAVTFIDITSRVIAERALAASEELQRVVLDHAGQCIVRMDHTLRVDYANRLVFTRLPRALETLVGVTLADVSYPATASATWDSCLERVFAAGTAETFEYDVVESARHGWYEATLRPQFGFDGTVTHVILTDRDITRRKEAEAAAQARQAQVRAAERAAHVGSWTLDFATMHRTWSEELLLMHGLDPAGPPPDEARLAQLFTPESWQELSAALVHTQQNGTPFELEVELVRPDGLHAWLLVRGELELDAAGIAIGVRGVSADITEAKRTAAELHILATRDAVTGLINRSMMFDELNRALVEDTQLGRATAVLVLDLDHFKNINETRGHGLGDALLAAAAARIVTVVGVGDLVARAGGDEFMVMMHGLTDPQAVLEEAQRLVVAFRRPFLLGEIELFTTVSIGLAIATENSDAGDLFRDADTALYAAKREGRDRFSAFNEELRADVTARVAIESELRRSLERAQLAVWYQPEIDLATGRVVAVEALLRWHHPDGSVWTANRFVDVAEATGMILSIGEWVFEQACRQVVEWAAAFPDRRPTVRVNFSALQLAEVGLLRSIDSVLAATGADPTMLCAEITETALLRETTAARANLRGIHERGIGIAIDDFGTGYASLTYLNTFPVDVIKIDRSFIVGNSDPNHRLVAGIISLARILNISVTAEGVELPEHASQLREMGCPSAQGWLYSKAVPAAEVSQLFDHVFPHP